MLFNSLKKINAEVDKEARIYPAHGSGSSCGKKIDAGSYCVLKNQLLKNYALQITNEEQFVKTIL